MVSINPFPFRAPTTIMAFSKSLTAYPPAFLELYEKAMSVDGSFTIPCQSRAQADRTRMIFYGIKHAIRNTKGHPLADQIDAKQIIITKNNEVKFRLPSESPRELEGQLLLQAALNANATE